MKVETGLGPVEVDSAIVDRIRSSEPKFVGMEEVERIIRVCMMDESDRRGQTNIVAMRLAVAKIAAQAIYGALGVPLVSVPQNNPEDSDRYYIDDQEVSREEYIRIERASGFFPKAGNGPATGSFTSGNGRTGRIEYAPRKTGDKVPHSEFPDHKGGVGSSVYL